MHSPNSSQDYVTYIPPSPPTSWHLTQKKAQWPDPLLQKYFSLGFPPKQAFNIHPVLRLTFLNRCPGDEAAPSTGRDRDEVEF